MRAGCLRLAAFVRVGFRYASCSAMACGEIPRLLLFDIDGTLTTSHYKDPVSKHPVSLALSEAFCRQIHRTSIQFAGGTDRSIIREVLYANGITEDNTPDYEDRVSETLRILPGYMKRGVLNGYNWWSPLPNVHNLLERLSKLDNVRIALLTGNIIEDARIKLESASVDLSYFEIQKNGHKELLGAFGTDHEIRSMLVPFAQKRYSEYIGMPVSPSDMIVIGDSPKDVICAHDNGVACVAVGTGPCPVQTLSDADYVLENGFEDLDLTVKVITETQLRT